MRQGQTPGASSLTNAPTYTGEDVAAAFDDWHNHNIANFDPRNTHADDEDVAAGVGDFDGHGYDLADPAMLFPAHHTHILGDTPQSAYQSAMDGWR